jgi:23S rRNA (cytidine1920-2'-O)/16S rRNA (cytidine1409-2'-O)-methyltransferase
MRADKYFAEKFGSRTKSAEAIEKGLVLVNGHPIKPKDEVNETDDIVFVRPSEFFVSNGGYKLSRALNEFGYDCTGKAFADIGASTGGFTDCLLQRGAKIVFAVDVGESLLHETLKSDKRVISLENTNARHLTNEIFSAKIEGVVADVSFISLRLILPSINAILDEDGCAFVLVKPQFECENKNIGKSGIVHPSAHAKIVQKVLEYCRASNLYPFGIVNAPVRKGKNIEYVLYLRKVSYGAKSEREICSKVEEFVKLYSQGILQ